MQIQELKTTNISRNAIIMLLIVVFVSLSVFLNPMFGVSLVALVALCLFFAHHLDLALYILVILTPFVYLQAVWGQFNVPLSDLFAMVVFLSLLFEALMAHRASLPAIIKKSAPEAVPFLLFILASAFSFLNTPDFWLSLKYLLRPILFFYLMFIVLPVAAIRDTKILKNVFLVSFFLGIVVAGMGFVSLFLGAQSGDFFRRAIPLEIFGMSPLGTNHNLIAEVLVAVIPLGWFLVENQRGNRRRWQVFWLANIFLAVICILTFSRAGWIVLFIEALVYLIWKYGKNVARLKRSVLVLFLMVLPLSVAMFFFSATHIVQSSNANRVLLNATAYAAWVDHPWIGNGLNTFLSFVEENTVFMLEFGAPLDSHGVVQKLAVEVGLIGTFFFLVFLLAMGRNIVSAYRASRSEELRNMLVFASLAALGILVFEFFNTSYFIGKLWLPIGIALACAKLARQEGALKLKRL